MSIHRLFCSTALLMVATAAGATTKVVITDPDTAQLVAPFSVARSTQVPGKTLKAGSYSIRVVDHLSDRVIVQIEDAKGASQSRFLALTDSMLHTASGSTGPLFWTNGANKTSTLRGFAFPGGSSVEFVYPKEDAVVIAKLNASKVPAIDPVSEGKVPAKNLSNEDMQTVTLWTLSPTRVGAGDASEPAIEAQRYQPPSPRESIPVSNAHGTAQLAMVSAPRSPRGLNSMQAMQAPKPLQVASSSQQRLKALPHTASSQPALELFGILALSFGILLRYTRLSAREG